jgi:hypothetical protein
MLRLQAKAQSLASWIEANVRLPAGTTAEPGPIKLYLYQRGILEAIADPKIERVCHSRRLVRARRALGSALLTHTYGTPQ